MLSTSEFESLIKGPESATLDFKSSMYDFTNEIELRETAKFVKDVISFCNTVRSETGYIVFGIQDGLDGNKLFTGITEQVDDAVLQQKVKDKVFPRPVFHYYTFEFDNTRYGILEFPIVKYAVPITPVAKLKGLEIGKVYYRHGTSNSEALAMETIRINSWLNSLPENITQRTLVDDINRILIDLTRAEIKLSIIFAELYTLAQKYKLLDISTFCVQEIKGINQQPKGDELDYRLQNLFVSHYEIGINPFPNINSGMIKKELEKSDNVFKINFVFTQPIINIEEFLLNFEQRPNSIGSLPINVNHIFPELNESYQVYIYFFSDTAKSLYRNIRQKAIDKLMTVSLIN